MKQLLTSVDVEIPENITIENKSRHISVKGPRGILKGQFKHASIDI